MKVYRSAARIRAIEPSHVDEFYWSDKPGSITVYEPDGGVDTGLLDALGNRILSCNLVGPIGFNRE